MALRNNAGLFHPSLLCTYLVPGSVLSMPYGFFTQHSNLEKKAAPPNPLLRGKRRKALSSAATWLRGDLTFPSSPWDVSGLANDELPTDWETTYFLQLCDTCLF